MRELHRRTAQLALPRVAGRGELPGSMSQGLPRRPSSLDSIQGDASKSASFHRRCGWDRRALALILAASALLPAAVAEAPPVAFRDLYEIIRQQAPGIPESELDGAATEALLGRVRGRILTASEVGEPLSELPAIAGQQVLDRCAYVRIGQVTLGLAPQLTALLRTPEFADTRGLILDLRFAGGTDYAAAANVVDIFMATAAPILSWDTAPVISAAKTNAWTRPVTVLVNQETRAAAEAVAAALRQLRIALVIGGRTAGVGAVFKEVPLGDTGQRLRLAISAVKTADGRPLSAMGIEPDLLVRVRPEHERAYLADPFTIVLASNQATNAPVGGTNLITSSPTVVRRRASEAELVRQKRAADEAVAGSPADVVSSAVPTETLSGSAVRPTPAELGKVVKDPVLGRALDLLKGLALLSDR